MKEVIKFPSPEERKDRLEKKNATSFNTETSQISSQNTSLSANNEDALPTVYYSSNEDGVRVGGGCKLIINGRTYEATIVEILERDKFKNVTKVYYTVKFLTDDDPFKSGVAKFNYKIV